MTWHVYASTRFATGCLDASPNTKMNRLAEMSCSRYWIEGALGDAKIGKNCVIGKSVYIDEDVEIGDRVKVQNFVSVYKGVRIEDDVLVGPSVTFTND